MHNLYGGAQGDGLWYWEDDQSEYTVLYRSTHLFLWLATDGPVYTFDGDGLGNNDDNMQSYLWSVSFR